MQQKTVAAKHFTNAEKHDDQRMLKHMADCTSLPFLIATAYGSFVFHFPVCTSVILPQNGVQILLDICPKTSGTRINFVRIHIKKLRDLKSSLAANLSFRQKVNLAYSPKFCFAEYSGYTVHFIILRWKLAFMVVWISSNCTYVASVLLPQICTTFGES